LFAPSVFSNVFFRPVSCVPGVTSVSGLSILDCPFGFSNVYFRLVSCVHKNGQSRDTGNTGYTRHRTKINVRENRRGNLEWTIQRHCNIGYTGRRQTKHKNNNTI
jgi:hypothetical protein